MAVHSQQQIGDQPGENLHQQTVRAAGDQVVNLEVALPPGKKGFDGPPQFVSQGNLLGRQIKPVGGHPVVFAIGLVADHTQFTLGLVDVLRMCGVKNCVSNVLDKRGREEMKVMSKLAGKVALVTGSGRGIGRAVALKLASEGAAVVINDLEADVASETVEAIQQAGGKAVACVGSVTASGFADKFIQTAIDNFGGIDIIVNNAGYTVDSMIGKMTDEQFDDMYEVHLKAPFQILRAAFSFIASASKQEAAEGREVFRKVVNISSVAGTGGNIGQANYSSMKAGVIGLTKTLSKEWGRLKVNVNCVAFGVIETRLTESTDEKKTVMVDGNEVAVGIPTKVKEAFAKMIPLGRAGSSEEAADAVYLFCCPESNYVSGQVLICGGGLSL